MALRINVYRLAWQYLKDGLQDKTSWGRNEILQEMQSALEQALAEAEDAQNRDES